MFVKLQLDSNLFLVCSSTRTSPHFGVSISPNAAVSVSPLENAEPTKKFKPQRLLETSNGAVKKLNLIHQQNWDKVSVDKQGNEQRKPNWDYAKSSKKKSFEAQLGGDNGNCSVQKVHTKCSTKFPNYGGWIPSILTALETIENLDEAMKPWEDTLSNKERSIILKEQTNWERAMEIFEWLKRKGCYELNVIHYNIMIRILGKSRQWDHLESLCNEMCAKRIPLINSTYGTLIDVYTKGGLIEKALYWLEKMNEQRMEPDEVTMGIVMQMYKKAGEFRKGEAYFKKWSSKSLKAKRISRPSNRNVKDLNSNVNTPLSSYTYNTLIDTYGKGGKVKEASGAFLEMIGKGIKPTTVTFNTMIHMFGNHGQLEEVGELIRKMEELNCPPDTRTYNILISVYAKHNDINRAARYFRVMKRRKLEPDLVSYRTLLYALSIRHMVNEAEALVSEMDEKGLEIDEYTQSGLTRMYIEAGKLEKSCLWFKRFHLSGKMSPECYSANIDAYGERGHISEAEKVFECCLEGKKHNVLVFNVMIKAYGLGKNYDKACELFDSMETRGVVPDRCSYSSLIQILASADLPEKASFYLRKMQEARLVNDCVLYCAVISSFVKLGKLEMAEDVYEEMIRVGVKPDVIVYGVLINAFAESGSVKEAMAYFDAMKRAGLLGNEVIYNSLIKLYTKVGYLREALETYELLQSLESGPDVYSSNCMIDLYCEQAMVKQAEEIFRTMKEKGIASEFTYAMMLCMYKRLGRYVEANRVAKEMRELGLLSDILSYNNVIGLYAVDSRFRDALGTFRDMIGANVEPDDCTFKSLGMILVKCGISKQAVGKLEATRKKDSRDGLQAWLTTLSTVIEVEDDDSYII